MSHYYDQKQSSKIKKQLISAVIRQDKYEFISASGIFSVKAIDTGSSLLASKCLIQDDWDVLDLGCGYGVVGIVIAKEFPSCKVMMSDINERAVGISKENIEKYRLKNITVIQSDLFREIDQKFDTILCNPPYVAGRALTFKIIEESKKHLKENGVLQVVFRHQKGGKVVMEKMKSVFGNCKDIAKKSGYRIYVSANV